MSARCDLFPRQFAEAVCRWFPCVPVINKALRGVTVHLCAPSTRIGGTSPSLSQAVDGTLVFTWTPPLTSVFSCFMWACVPGASPPPHEGATALRQGALGAVTGSSYRSVFCVRTGAPLSKPGADPPLAQESLPSVPLTAAGWLLTEGRTTRGRSPRPESALRLKVIAGLFTSRPAPRSPGSKTSFSMK